MDRAQVERLLRQVNAEKADAQVQVADAQDRLNKLAKAADGLESLLEMTPQRLDQIIGSDPEPARPAEPATVNATSIQPAIPAGVPKGKAAAKIVLQSDTSKFWTVGDVDREEIRRGWSEPRPRGGAKRNSPARIALARLQEEFPDNVDVIQTPVLAFRWTDRPSPSLNGPAA